MKKTGIEYVAREMVKAAWREELSDDEKFEHLYAWIVVAYGGTMLKDDHEYTRSIVQG